MEAGDIAEVITRMARDFARRRERREEAYKYDRREFDLWVSSAKAPRSAMKAFREFDLRFSQLSVRDQESVGADKVPLFLKSVNERGRMAIFPYLEDDEGAYGLTEDWNEVEWACIQCDERRSATTRPASGGEERAATDYALPPEESSTQIGSEELDIEALVREAYEIVEAQIEAEEGLIAESGPSGSEDEEAEREWYIGTTGEGAERATLSTCGERSTEDEVGDGEAAIADSSGHEGVRAWRPETSSGEKTGGGAGTLRTPGLETPATGPRAGVRPRVTGGGGGKAGDHDGDMGEGAERATLSSCGEWTAMEAGNYGFGTWRPETSREEETSGGAATLHTPALEAPAVGPIAGVRPRATGGGGGKAGNRDNGMETVEEEAASIIDACIYGGGVATDDDVRMEVATGIASTSGGVATLHAPVQETPAAGPSARVRPRVTNGGGGKAGDHGDDVGEGAERATLSTCGKRTAMDEADIYGAMDATSRVGESFGTRLPETFYEDFASILEACEIEEEEETSGGAATFHTPVLETPATGPRAGVRPRETDGGGGKAGNRNDEEEVCSGRRRDPSTPGPETSAVAPERGHKTGEMGGGREDERPGVGTCEKTEGEVRSGIEERVGNRPDRKMSRSVIRPDREAERKKSEAGAGQPGTNRRKPARPGLFDRFVAGRVRLRWEPVRARRRPSGHGDHGLLEDREREGPSTPILETSAVADQRETGETAGGGEESEAEADKVIGAGIRYEMMDERVQDGELGSERATVTKEEVADAEVGSTADEGRNTKHALRSVKGPRTSMHPRERQRVTGNGGPIEPLRGEDSVVNREWEEPSTPTREASAVADRKENEETVGGGEELETDAEVGSTAEARHETHAIRPVEGQDTSMHTADGRQRLTDDDGRVKPSRGKRGTKDGAAKHQDRRHGPSAIGMSGESYLGKRRRCAENNGVHTGKRKRGGFPEGIQGQAGQEGASRGEAITRASRDTDTEVGMTIRSTTREHGEKGESEKRVMGSSKDRSTSTHSEGNIDIRGKPTEGKRGAERVGTPRCAARKGRNPACDRERIRRIYEADKGRATGSATAFGRTERGGKHGHRIRRVGCSRWFKDPRWTWRIGWRQRLGEHRRVWRIGWRRRFETIRRGWWTGRRRWFVWTGWSCSKWKTKPGGPTRTLRTRSVVVAENLVFSPLCFGTYRWMCG